MEKSTTQLATMELANIIKEARKSKSYTQQQLGKMCGVSQSFIAKLESGDALLSYEICLTLAGALDIPHEELWEKVEKARVEASQQRVHTRSVAMQKTLKEAGKRPASSVMHAQEETAEELANDPDLQDAHRNLQKIAFANSEIRETAVKALRFFAEAAQTEQTEQTEDSKIIRMSRLTSHQSDKQMEEATKIKSVASTRSDEADFQEDIGGTFEKAIPFQIKYTWKLYYLNSDSLIFEIQKDNKKTTDFDGKEIEIYVENTEIASSSSCLKETIQGHEAKIDLKKLGGSIENFRQVGVRLYIDESIFIEAKPIVSQNLVS